MSLSTALSERSEDKCELCAGLEGLVAYTVPPKNDDAVENQLALCGTCHKQIENPDTMNPNHWRCLNDSMWSQVPVVQVMTYRMLNKLSGESWAQDVIGLMYLDDQTMEWAQYGEDGEGAAIVHKDSNGHVLQAGDTVVLIKDLNVRGANLTAKRGTAVRKIRLDPDNANHIEGKVDGQTIVILTQYVKKN